MNLKDVITLLRASGSDIGTDADLAAVATLKPELTAEGRRAFLRRIQGESRRLRANGIDFGYREWNLGGVRFHGDVTFSSKKWASYHLAFGTRLWINIWRVPNESWQFQFLGTRHLAAFAAYWRGYEAGQAAAKAETE